MSKKFTFKEGDRVQAPDKNKGTVRFVGTVHWTRGIWVGVEFDNPVGKNDGTERNKRYFTCPPKHGIFQKDVYWKAINDKKGGKSKKGNDKSGKKGGKKGKSDKGGGKSKPAKEASPTPPPPKPKVITIDSQVQTDPPEETVSNQYLCKLISRMFQDQLDKVTQQRDEFQKQLLQNTKTNELASSELMQLKYDNEMKSTSLEKLQSEIEDLKLENEDLKIKSEMLQMDIDEAREQLQDNFTQFKASLSMDDQQKAEILQTNEELQKTIESLFNTGIEAINSKDKAIFDLTMDANYMGTLSERVNQLLSVEREAVQLRSEIKELRDNHGALQDAEKMVKQLTEANNELEGELQDWREYVLDVDNERAILEELHTEDEELIKELRTYGQRVSADFANLNKKYQQKDVEINDMQKELFKLRMEVQQINSAQESGLEFAEISSVVDSGSGIEATATDNTNIVNDNNDGGNNGKKLQIIINENVSLKSQLKQIRSILIKQISNIVNGRSDYVHRNILSLYFPTTLKIDVTGIEALKLLERTLKKAGFARDLLERFYANPSSAALKNPNLARQAYYLCPLILEQENYVRALQKGLLGCKDGESWKKTVTQFGRLNNLEKAYDSLLEKIDSTTLEEYNDQDLTNNKKLLSEFVKKNFASFDIEIDVKDEERVEKSQVLLIMSETNYRFQNLSLRLNEFNAKMHKIVHAPAQTTNTITSQIAGGDSDTKDEDMKSGDDTVTTDGAGGSINNMSSRPVSPNKHANIVTETVNGAINSLRIGVIEKMFKLRHTLLDHLKQIISKSQPIDLGFRTKYINLLTLQSANRTQIKYIQLKLCKTDARKAVERIEGMLNKLKQVTTSLAPKERVNKINKIFEEEEEHNPDGLLNVLDSAYSNVRSVKTIVDSSVNSTLRNTDELPDLSYEERKELNESKEFPQWEMKASEIRDKIDEAGQIREDMENMKIEMKQQKEQVLQTHKTLDEQRSIIATIQTQRDKEKDKVTDLHESQKRTIELTKENDIYKTKNEKLEKENKEHLEKLRENNELIKKYKKSMEKYKDKQLLGGKPSTRTLDLDTGFSNRSRTNSRADRSENGRGVGIRSLSLQPKSPLSSQRRSVAFGAGLTENNNLALKNNNSNNSINLAMPIGSNGIINKALLGAAAANALSNYYDEEDVTYSELLQETIQTLRRKITQLTLKNKIVNCDLGLKPLPLVNIKNILNDPNKKNNEKDNNNNDNKDKNERKEKKKKTRKVKKMVKKRVKKNKENEDTDVTTEKKDENDNENETETDTNKEENESGTNNDEYEEIEVETEIEEEVTDDESDNDEDTMKEIEIAQKAINKQNNEVLNNALKELSGNLNNLRAKPVIIDIAKKTFAGQDVIGRQFKLRDIHLKYLNLKEEIRKHELQKDEMNDENNENSSKNLGTLLGKVLLPNSSIAHSQKVRINPQKLDQFKQSFL